MKKRKGTLQKAVLCWIQLFVIPLLCWQLAAQQPRLDEEDTVVVPDTMYNEDDLVYDTVKKGEDVFSFDVIDRNDTTHYQQRTVNKGTVPTLKNEDDFWYADYAPPKQEEEKAKAQQNIMHGNLKWLRALLWIVIITGFVLIILFILSSGSIKLFQKRSHKIAEEQTVPEQEDIFTIDYPKELEAAVSSKNYRLAIRLLYLSTLKALTHNNIIQYKTDLTNSDYLQQLHNTSYYKPFFRLTREFEYAWYGKFEIPEASYRQIYNDFETFKKGLPS